MGTSAALLLLADSRFPTGAHAHSAGVEASHARGDIRDVRDLSSFLDGRLQTTAPVDAAFAAAACAGRHRLAELDLELFVRTPSPRLCSISRSLGRQLVRPAERAWPSARYAELRAVHADGPMQAVALGVVAGAAGLTPTDAALCSLHHLVGAITTATVRLLGLDPFEVHALAASLAPRLDELAATAASLAELPPCELPATTSVLADLLAEHHATWEVRLFAS
ncbi:MAG: urease accessory protein UreF [Actinobacteria bacterium]|nr:urease accessory protein UreF [Actinomycetota bacterium]